ncbi:hypothetical protein MP638_002668 [Amoeboaphelidium occidentale]|nr:hypothetical protein MP638_002668 [Amoeboaphelidium occidentale]
MSRFAVLQELTPDPSEDEYEATTEATQSLKEQNIDKPVPTGSNAEQDKEAPSNTECTEDDNANSAANDTPIEHVETKAAQPSIISDVITSITDPLEGKATLPFNRGVITIVYGSSALLLVVWAALFAFLPFGSEEQFHVGAMIIVTLAFMGSFQWFITMCQRDYEQGLITFANDKNTPGHKAEAKKSK